MTGAKRRKGSKVHAAVDTLGHVPTLHVMPANAQDQAQVGRLAEATTGQTVAVAFGDQGYTGDEAAVAAAAHGIRLEAVMPEAKRGVVLLSHRWVVERSFVWARRVRRLAATTNGCRKRSRGWISSPLLV